MIAAAHVPPNHLNELEYELKYEEFGRILNGLYCEVCGLPQWDTYGGSLCGAGHGGVDGLAEDEAQERFGLLTANDLVYLNADGTYREDIETSPYVLEWEDR